MRITILAAPKVGRVSAALSRPDLALADRIAEGIAYPGECVVRLPRRVSKRIASMGRGAGSMHWIAHALREF